MSIDGCDGKVKYTDHSGAELGARRIRRFNEDAVEAYKCRLCGWWHIGHGGLKSTRPKQRDGSAAAAERIAVRMWWIDSHS